MNQTTTKRPALAAEKPRRPLSCFNLFYRYKRTLVFDAHHSGTASDDVAIKQIIREAAGTEESPMAHLASLSEAERNVLRRAKIRSVLEHNLLPNTYIGACVSYSALTSTAVGGRLHKENAKAQIQEATTTTTALEERIIELFRSVFTTLGL